MITWNKDSGVFPQLKFVDLLDYIISSFYFSVCGVCSALLLKFSRYIFITMQLES